MIKSLSLFAIIAILVLVGCSPKKTSTLEPTITVTILPQKFFVDQIAGPWLNVNVMVAPGGNPHTYEPTPNQMKDLSHSNAYLKLGPVMFEKVWMDKLQSVNPDMKVFETSEGLEMIADDNVCSEDHDHSVHDHKADNYYAYNPHIWLSPSLVKQQSANILKALITLYPERQAEMQQNFERFSARIDSLQAVLSQKLADAGGTKFIVYHPSWTYLAHEFHLTQVAIEHNGKEATADRLKTIIDYANEHNIRLIFVQKEFSNVQAKTIADQINGDVIVINPLEYDWFTTMDEFANAFAVSNQNAQ